MSNAEPGEPGDIGRAETLLPPVVWDHWEGGDVIPNGRLVRHRPSGSVFAVTWHGDELRAELVDGPNNDETEEIGRMACGYFRLVGSGTGWTFRRKRLKRDNS